MGEKTRGLYRKFFVERADGSSDFGCKHYNCDYFVLDLTCDPFAWAALEEYAHACDDEYPLLARDLFNKIEAHEAGTRNRNGGR